MESYNKGVTSSLDFKDVEYASNNFGYTLDICKDLDLWRPIDTLRYKYIESALYKGPAFDNSIT